MCSLKLTIMKPDKEEGRMNYFVSIIRLCMTLFEWGKIDEKYLKVTNLPS